MNQDRHYYRRLMKKSRSYVVDLASKQWCDFDHTHLDWEGKGNEGRVHRVRHLNAHLRALRRARVELLSHPTPYQLFAVIDLSASEDDAIYVHTANPNGTVFPAEFDSAYQEASPPPLLACRVDRSHFKVLRETKPGSQVYLILSRTSEA